MWSRAIKQTEVVTDAVDWDVVYAEHMPRVYNFFRYRVGEGALAEDLTATTWEKAWVARERYRRDLGAFSTWLFTIAQHVAIDYFRKRRDDLPLEHARSRHAHGSPEETVERQSDFARLAVLLAALSDRERELVALKYGASLTNREIAKLSGLTESNVGSILHRVTVKLRAGWDG